MYLQNKATVIRPRKKMESSGVRLLSLVIFGIVMVSKHAPVLEAHNLMDGVLGHAIPLLGDQI
jgi:hypothetical protein